MSNTHDPVTKILDTLYGWKHESSKVLNKTLDTLQDSQAYRYAEDLLTGSKTKIDSIYTSSQPKPPPSVWESSVDWVREHKLLVGGVLLAAAGGTGYYAYAAANPPTKRKRRAQRAPNGARTEVVVVAGSPSESITRLVAADLDKRGFIVYLTATSTEEEAIVLKENSPDIRPLQIKAQEAASVEQTIRKFGEMLDTPVRAFDGAHPHKLHLAGVMVVPDLYFPCGPVESLRADTWSDLVYSKLLGPIFLLSNGLLELVRSHNSRVILMTPSIMSSLNPAFHSAECITANALSSLALCLHRELKPQGVPLIHMKLGSFNISPSRPSKSQEQQVNSAMRADVLSWSEKLRHLYGRSYQASAHLQTARATQGSNIRVLNYAVYDALTMPNPARTWYVGRGSYAYKFLADWLPETALTWLLMPSESKPSENEDWETV
ncbi:hypothetical protein TRVA0_056S00936 [Trichomonascus vanleenenianus]|uniref:DUF1776 domain-containing protein n=1 Tax=Trichomonascus vanleenenianus TaxID=2268995 RepID=UPI003EC98277